MSGAPSDNNIMLWNAVIFGPHDTPFEDGTFKLTIEFTEEYPNKPPTVRSARANNVIGFLQYIVMKQYTRYTVYYCNLNFHLYFEQVRQ